jgi:hypothetical protein
MYVEDTMIYLSKNDQYSHLEKILQHWCMASCTKFNMEKMEILPIGSKTHHDDVVKHRKINALYEPWHESVRVAKDGNLIQTLGAWIGNNIETQCHGRQPSRK